MHAPRPTTFSATGRVASAGSGASASPDSPPTRTISGTAVRLSMVAMPRIARLVRDPARSDDEADSGAFSTGGGAEASGVRHRRESSGLRGAPLTCRFPLWVRRVYRRGGTGGDLRHGSTRVIPRYGARSESTAGAASIEPIRPIGTVPGAQWTLSGGRSGVSTDPGWVLCQREMALRLRPARMRGRRSRRADGRGQTGEKCPCKASGRG